MKRCPQCEFVYEDEQTLCDMDGNKLVFDSRPLPKLQALTNPPPVSLPNSFWRGRLIPAGASLVLATVLGLVYYVSIQRQPRPQVIPAAQTRPSITPQPFTEPAKLDTANQPIESTKPVTAQPDKRESEAEVKPAATPKAETAVDTTKKKRPANLNTPQPQPAKPASSDGKPKQDSKVSAILKKTGRLLKKPFKF